MIISLAERVALVTGAGAGIGRAIALALAAAGARVVLPDIDMNAAAETARQVRAQGGQALPLACDVANPDQVKQTISAAIDLYGALHILVNNAGISPLCDFERIHLEDWNRVLAINLTGPFLFCQAALPYLRQAGCQGRIINIGSLAGQIGGIAVGAHYTASKGGVLALTRQLAKLLAPDRVTVNAISPSTTDTSLTQAWSEETRQALVRQIPLGRMGQPIEIANLAVFLASDAASFITGATLNINGGMFIA